MENIYKIKIRSNPDPRGLYPSERRYSASIVLGLSVVHICLGVTATLMAVLTLKTSNNNTLSNETDIYDDNTDLIMVEFWGISNLAFSCCGLILGSIVSGLSGLLAWKRWYIDRNIKWFFFASVFSTLMTIFALFLSTVVIILLYQPMMLFSMGLGAKTKPNLRYTLTLNVFITCVLEFIWSCLSLKVSYKGMKNSYPDDIVLSNCHGKIMVNTVHRGNKKGKATPPDILSHFQAPKKFSKFFPREENGNLPKAESNREYQERVQKFLTSDADVDSSK